MSDNVIKFPCLSESKTPLSVIRKTAIKNGLAEESFDSMILGIRSQLNEAGFLFDDGKFSIDVTDEARVDNQALATEIMTQITPIFHDLMLALVYYSAVEDARVKSGITLKERIKALEAQTRPREIPTLLSPDQIDALIAKAWRN